MYSAKVLQLIADLEASHSEFHQSAVFGGPSLYFHKRALVDGMADDFSRFAESSYAMLTAWGMHRMGQGGAKMVDFEIYEASIKATWPLFKLLQLRQASSLQNGDWETLKKAFFGIRAMKSSFSLVANSKVLAHVIPNLVPPVDRQYTIRFLQKSKLLPENISGEWDLLRGFLQGFFYPILHNEVFIASYTHWCEANSAFVWNTSALKTIDNLVVGHVRRTTRLNV